MENSLFFAYVYKHTFTLHALLHVIKKYFTCPEAKKKKKKTTKYNEKFNIFSLYIPFTFHFF